MAGYQSRFDEAAAEAKRVFLSNGSAVREVLPGFWTSDFNRLVGSISDLLKKVDKSSVQHPEFLAHTNGHIAEHAVSLISTVPSSFEAGAQTFVQSNVAGLTMCEDRLSKAVGKHHHKVREVKDQYVRELRQIAEEAKESQDAAWASAQEAEKSQNIALSSNEAVTSASDEVELTRQEVAKIRNLVSKLASGDGRGKSLEALKRRAEGKLNSIEDVLVKGQTAEAAVEASMTKLLENQDAVDKHVQELEIVRAKASEILSLSNQAGLASAYLKEGRALAKKSFWFTIILYLAAAATLAAAMLYVIPTLETGAGASDQIRDNAIFLTLLRATILAPLVFVIYFTNRRIAALETLRMDYAEKAAASLAYSGYKDEMSVDTDLLDKLRGSLLLRFAEHPERLLRKVPTEERLRVKLPGFFASSTTNAEKSASDDKGGKAKDSLEN